MGRMPRYKTPDDMQAVIERYFGECDGEMLRDENGEPILNKAMEPVYLGRTPPTVTGLALALGFNSRQALLNYTGKEKFNDTITRAKARCEAYAESRLYDRDGARGAAFSLQHNFKWVNEETGGDNGILPALLKHLQGHT